MKKNKFDDAIRKIYAIMTLETKLYELRRYMRECHNISDIEKCKDVKKLKQAIAVLRKEGGVK